ncbi:hypothetical protein [Mesorhizobium sp.]|nr:hypothetical protein [Mesorhizobium sp.]
MLERGIVVSYETIALGKEIRLGLSLAADMMPGFVPAERKAVAGVS